MANHYTRHGILLQFFEDNFSLSEESSGEEAEITHTYLGSQVMDLEVAEAPRITVATKSFS